MARLPHRDLQILQNCFIWKANISVCVCEIRGILWPLCIVFVYKSSNYAISLMHFCWPFPAHTFNRLLPIIPVTLSSSWAICQEITVCRWPKSRPGAQAELNLPRGNIAGDIMCKPAKSGNTAGDSMCKATKFMETILWKMLLLFLQKGLVWNKDVRSQERLTEWFRSELWGRVPVEYPVRRLR